MKYNSSASLNRSTVFLSIPNKNGNTKFASGFHFKFNSNSTHYLVTNRHVMIDATNLIFSIKIVDNPDHLGIIPDVLDATTFHPDPKVDLCIINLNNALSSSSLNKLQDITTSYIHESMILSSLEIENLNYIEDIITFGAPHSLYDSINANSIARKGITATHPNKQFSEITDFLIDASVYPGTSGSGIYLCNENCMSRFENTKLLGIICNAHYGNLKLSDPQIEGNAYINLGHAILAHKLLALKP